MPVSRTLNRTGNPSSVATPVATTTTANCGLYLFSVRAANYFVYVPASQFGSAGPLYGMKPARGRTDNTVPNIDDSGDQNALASSKPIATGVKTGVFTLASGVMVHICRSLCSNSDLAAVVISMAFIGFNE